MYALSSEDFSMDDSSTTMNLFKYISDNVINDLMMYRTSNVISSNTNSNSVKLQNQLQQQKNFLNSINLDNNTTSGSIVNSGVSGVGVITSTPTSLGGKTVATAAGASAVLNNNIQQSDENMKTENVMITTVKVEPLNYTVSNSQPYNENMYTKRPRLESDEWMTNSSNNVNVGSQNNVIGGFATSPISNNINYDGFNSPHGKVGIQDLSPSSMNGSIDGKNTKTKKGPVPRQQEELCLVCGDRASGYHYNALTCEGCKGFFRRSVTKNAVYCCKFGHECEMDMYMRRKCQECRLKKCLAVGMRPECVVPENQCAIKRKEKKAQKEKDKIATGATSSTSQTTTTINNATTIIRPANRIDNAFKNEVLPQLMKCDPPPHAVLQALLPEKLLLENKAKNIPQLTANQMAVIYKLIWYQDGYEQPSEEDLKRIMNGSEEEEDQCDLHFRHITEITILTVQLIVEFAKGLPAFTKIPQEDQITLLKACSSEVMMLRMARRYDASTDSILFANNRSYTRESYRMAGMAETIEDLLHFCRQMYSLTIDNVEYALLTAIVIFSDRPGLEKADLVEYIQEYYIETLKVYIMNRHGGDKKCNILFAKLLAVLTELRTLGNQNSEMCFSLKLKNKKLPRFLEEIWDVQDVPQNSTVTTNTTHIIQHAINDNSHNEEHMMH